MIARPCISSFAVFPSNNGDQNIIVSFVDHTCPKQNLFNIDRPFPREFMDEFTFISTHPVRWLATNRCTFILWIHPTTPSTSCKQAAPPLCGIGSVSRTSFFENKKTGCENVPAWSEMIHLIFSALRGVYLVFHQYPTNLFEQTNHVLQQKQTKTKQNNHTKRHQRHGDM